MLLERIELLLATIDRFIKQIINEFIHIPLKLAIDYGEISGLRLRSDQTPIFL